MRISVRYVLFGLVAGLMMLLLAVTSYNAVSRVE
jgi:DMSO/TMAO reductase YedYZ heme-binding membrane subunit